MAFYHGRKISRLYLDVFMWKCDCYFSNCNHVSVTMFGRLSEVHGMQKGYTLCYMKSFFFSAFEWRVLANYCFL
jgi:hypothetical protein